jgi:hypothetical protein
MGKTRGFRERVTDLPRSRPRVRVPSPAPFSSFKPNPQVIEIPEGYQVVPACEVVDGQFRLYRALVPVSSVGRDFGVQSRRVKKAR